MNKKLYVISGCSGVGKGTIINEFMKRNGKDFVLSVSCTTRAPRQGEINGVNYFFLSQEEFKRNIRNTNSNMDKLNDIINHIFNDNEKLLDFNNYKLDDINNFEDNNLFFEMLKNISKPLKYISSEYFKILLSIAELKNK
jgi:excinuclease UvrABC ATPase subunit